VNEGIFSGTAQNFREMVGRALETFSNFSVKLIGENSITPGLDHLRLTVLFDGNSPGWMHITTALHTAPARERAARLDNIQHRYNPNWSCPLTPFENRVKVPVQAGEKMFNGQGHA
jgi:hypothetical protein